MSQIISEASACQDMAEGLNEFKVVKAIAVLIGSIALAVILIIKRSREDEVRFVGGNHRED